VTRKLNIYLEVVLKIFGKEVNPMDTAVSLFVQYESGKADVSCGKDLYI